MFDSLEIFGKTLSWYYTMQGLALFFTILFFVVFLRPILSDIGKQKLMLFIPFFVLFMYLGCRLFYLLEHYLAIGETIHYDFKNLTNGRLRWYGGVFVYGVLGYVMLKMFFGKNHMEKRVFDILGLALCLFAGIVKLGCQFSGDGCYGKATNLPWGMHYLNGTYPSLLPVHPTPLYDSIFHLSLFILLVALYKRRTFSNGTVGLFFLGGTAVFNLFLGFLRDESIVSFNLTFLQICYVLLFLTTVIHLFVFSNKRNNVVQ